ncbi:hypothetical protein BDF14DRAFT_1777869 [Spinellus fusiger]|nr:hypothetical protein BDF14DRAFT_1777869 [Spinellus fusiger]
MAASHFIHWCKEQGIHAPHVKIEKTAYAGNGLITTQSCSPQQPLVQIPNSLILTAPRVLSQGSAVFSQTLKECLLVQKEAQLEAALMLPKNEKLCLRLFLLYENHHRTPFWQAYREMLPSIESLQETHVVFSGHTLLKGTQLYASVQAKRAALEKEFCRLQSLSGGWLKDTSLEAWLWADTVFWSRVVSLGSSRDREEHSPDVALIPFFDIANHGVEPNVRWELTSQGMAIVCMNGTGLLPNQELLLSYGEKSNQELLFLHGFCLENNPVPSQVKIPVAPFLDLGVEEDERKEGDSLGAQKGEWLNQKSIHPVVTLQKKNAQEEAFVGVHAIFGSTGWSFQSIVLIYLVVLDQDDGLVISRDLQNTPQPSASMDPEQPVHANLNVYIRGQSIEKMASIADQVALMEHCRVIQLRVVMLLLDALAYHLDALWSNYGESAALLSTSIAKYRQEEADGLEHASGLLVDIRDQLVEDDSVLKYLSGHGQE